MVNTQVLIVKDKVQRYAKQLFNVISIDDDGDLRINYESTHIIISVIEKDSSTPEQVEFRRENDISQTIVNVYALVVMGADVTNELYKWIATEGQGYNYGSFGINIDPENQKKCVIKFTYNIEGDTLDPGELKNALLMCATIADDEDENLQKMFGGKIWSDD